MATSMPPMNPPNRNSVMPAVTIPGESAPASKPKQLITPKMRTVQRDPNRPIR